MTDTKTEPLALVTKPDNPDDRLATFTERKAAAGPVDGMVTVIEADSVKTGQTGTLMRIDEADPNLTFLVQFDDAGRDTLWVYAVKPADEMDSLALRDAAIARLRQKVSAAETTLAHFKEQVREVAIRVAQEQSWCDDGLNGVLEELGLPKKNTRWVKTATVEITVRWDGTAEDGADIRVDEDGQVLFPGSTRNDEIEIDSVSWSEPEEDE